MKRIPKKSPNNKGSRSPITFSSEAAELLAYAFGEGYRRLNRRSALAVAQAATYSVRCRVSLYRGMKDNGALGIWLEYLEESFPEETSEALKALYCLDLSHNDLLALSEYLSRESRSGRWGSVEKRSIAKYAGEMGYSASFDDSEIALECEDGLLMKGSPEYILSLLERIDKEGVLDRPREQADELERLQSFVVRAENNLGKTVSLVEQDSLALPLTQEEKDCWVSFVVPLLLELDRFNRSIASRLKEARNNEGKWESYDE